MGHTAATRAASCSLPVMVLLAHTADDEYRLGASTWTPSALSFHAGHAAPLELREWTPLTAGSGGAVGGVSGSGTAVVVAVDATACGSATPSRLRVAAR